MIRIDMPVPENCTYCPFCTVKELIGDDNVYTRFECIITGEYIPDEVVGHYELFNQCPVEEDVLL